MFVCCFSLQRQLRLLLLQPHEWYKPTRVLTLNSTGRAVGERVAPIDLLCLHEFVVQTEHSRSLLKDCKASSVLVMKSQLKLNKEFNSISHLQSATEKCLIREHSIISFENALFSKFREETGDNHINSHISIPIPFPYI